jgi:DNA repair exonuclease SbcCD ATPase subunit
MSNIMEYESISEKIKGLENELDTFIQVVHEIKEIRNMVGTLPDDLKQNNLIIETRKKELEKLIASANNQLANFEQRARDVILDLEKKTEALATEAKSRISGIKNTAQNSGDELLELNKETVEEMDGKHKKLYNSLETMKAAVDSQGKSINDLQESYLSISELFGKMEKSLFKTLTRQEYIITMISLALITGIGFSIYLFFSR